MLYAAALGTFLTVTMMIYGLLYKKTGVGVMESRLSGLRYQKPGREALPDPEASFSARVLRPLGNAVSKRANSVLPSTISQKLEMALQTAGLRMSPGKFIAIIAVTGGVLPLLVLAMSASSGGSAMMTLVSWAGASIMGVYIPRMWLGGKIKKRQKLIQKSLPDAFDLVTASVEAGLGIDAAFARVVEKVKGPFAEELGRTNREITMGRSRREAFQDMADRTGVDDLRSLVNSIIQAELMGISVGGVIRIQTDVMRTKRKQRAEEQAFKAPVKMVFPLVFFIFPAIGIVIGGPAVIQMMNAGF